MCKKELAASAMAPFIGYPAVFSPQDAFRFEQEINDKNTIVGKWMFKILKIAKMFMESTCRLRRRNSSLENLNQVIKLYWIIKNFLPSNQKHHPFPYI